MADRYNPAPSADAGAGAPWAQLEGEAVDVLLIGNPNPTSFPPVGSSDDFYAKPKPPPPPPPGAANDPNPPAAPAYPEPAASC